MPINPLLALQAQSVDTATPINRLIEIQDRNRARGLQERGLESQEQQVANQTERLGFEREEFEEKRNQFREKSTLIGSAVLSDFLEAGDTDGAKAFLQRRVDNITARGGDPGDTLEAIEMLDNNPEQLQSIARGGKKEAIMRGLVTPGDDGRITLKEGEQVINPDGSIFAQNTPEPERFEPIRDQSGNIVGQRNTRTGKVVSDPRAPKQPDTVINNIQGDAREKFAEELGKREAEMFLEGETAAREAADGIAAAEDALELLDSGVITGFGADFRVGLGKALQQAGFNVNGDAIANSEAFTAAQAQEVARIVKQFGAGSGLSDKDREFATKAAAGEITLNEDSIRRIIALNIKAKRNIIQAHNKKARKLPEGLSPFDHVVEVSGTNETSDTSETFDFREVPD